jgi:hypothetical protein
MIKTILIATDFSLESLEILKKFLKIKQNRMTRINIIFFSFRDMIWAILSEISYSTPKVRFLKR